jgi:predicted acetyltransferase
VAQIDLRWATADDAADYASVVEQVYLRGDTLSEADRIAAPGQLQAIARIDGHPVGSFLVESYEITCRGETLRCAGIAAVGVPPTSRGQGVGHALMGWALHELRALGFDIAALYGFSHRYYRAFGYETSGIRWQLTVPPHRMPKVRSDLTVRRVTPGKVLDLDACYREFARQHTGVNLRTADQWHRRLGEKAPLVYAVGDPICGYLWTKMEGGFWDTLRIGELVWSSREGYLALLDVVAGLIVNRKEAIWFEPHPSPFLSEFDDQGILASRERPTMYRTLNVASVLEKVRVGGTWTVEVNDPQLSANSGVWSSSGQASQVPADFQVDQPAFTQAMLGDPSWSTLRQFGRVTVQNEGNFKDVCARMPQTSVLCTEFF